MPQMIKSYQISKASLWTNPATKSEAVSSVGSEDAGEVWGAHPEPREAQTGSLVPCDVSNRVKSAGAIGVGNWPLIDINLS